MKVLVLGATGSIGTAVARELAGQGHTVLALCRSDASERDLKALGYETLRGDLRRPEDWAGIVNEVDGVIQAAVTFTEDMGDVDRGVIDALIAAAPPSTPPVRFVYTGGCWLYGATGDDVATEDSPFNPISSFVWMVENAERLTASGKFSTAVIHPAMVYHRAGGVFTRFLEKAKAGEPIEVWGGADTRWPLIHRDDLAVAYRLLLENRDVSGHFNASAQPGVPVGKIVEAIAAKYDAPPETVILSKEGLVAEHGAWAEGPTLDQQMASERLRGTCKWRPRIDAFETSDLFD
ncbi:NAD-dependent epimerase/dehydratase family protein [Hwanghaeella grinnelliae]|uniref:NAD-dependent epimerase/dehydratase family protein n=1 Tax=Hwanghaeella grinnelliae TaxID=2500179 RepID=A0A3S2WUF6_9PROT|nr:NAD-dependent epimerase/dehydratase family protein [Hwanghaeella grinnelliae]RVU38779.1 NAD-dependent epimerase/dehydratase family protein [Hwanghaeella grinnelliae]